MSGSSSGISSVQLVKTGPYNCFVDRSGITHVKTKIGLKSVSFLAIEVYYKIIIPARTGLRSMCGTKGCGHPWHSIVNRPYRMAAPPHGRCTKKQLMDIASLFKTGAADRRIKFSIDPGLAALPADVCLALAQSRGTNREAVYAGWCEVVKEDYRTRLNPDRRVHNNYDAWVSVANPEKLWPTLPVIEGIGWYDEIEGSLTRTKT